MLCMYTINIKSVIKYAEDIIQIVISDSDHIKLKTEI